jgi:arylsulfatase A-like enzyme/Flp pilus assembly protein TadD
MAVTSVWWIRANSGTVPTFSHGQDQNVLLITIDTLRADALGSYGGRARTPHLDRLANEGARFSFAHAHSVVTLPSHTSILTGRYPFDHGVRDNAGYRADDELDTLAEMAHRAGRPTGAFVGAFPLDRQFGLSQGFDVYDDAGGRGVDEHDFAFPERPATAVVASATNWISTQSTPWFAWVHVFDPHAPYAPPPPLNVEFASSPYHGEVTAVDNALGPLLDSLRASSRRTTVIVTSDHGEGLGDHGETTHGTFAYESTLRVPLIIAQIGGASTTTGAGAVITTPARHIDIVPTIADLMGWPVDTKWPGRSLAMPETDDPAARATYFEAMTPMLTRGWAPLRGVILGPDKYIDLPEEELYDVVTDQQELRNRVSDLKPRRDVLRARLDGLAAELPGATSEITADAKERLEALGYVAQSAPRKAAFTAADDPKRLIRLDQLMLDGITRYQEGRTADAVRIYEQVIKERPEMSLAPLRLAFIQWQAGDLGPALATLRAAAARHPDVDVDVRLATYLADVGDVAEATTILERVLAANPRHVPALNGLGIAYARSGRTADALGTFAKILLVQPREVQALENIGTVHLQRKAWAQASDAFRAALQVTPRSSRAHAGLGVIALEQGRRDEAIGHWQDAVAADPRNFDALFNLATELVNAGRFAEARPHLERFVRLAPRAFYGPDIDRLRALLERR